MHHKDKLVGIVIVFVIVVVIILGSTKNMVIRHFVVCLEEARNIDRLLTDVNPPGTIPLTEANVRPV